MEKGVFELILDADKGESYDLRKAWATPSNFALPEKWAEEHQEGQLAVDVADTEKELVIVSTMAGAVTEKIEVYIHNDLLTIRGVRVSPLTDSPTSSAGRRPYSSVDYFHQECYWGKFSRTIVLPAEVKADQSMAEYKNGVLIIRVPKQRVDAKVPVVIVDD